MPNPADAVSTYIHAKDGNRPHLMDRAFAETVVLEMVVNTHAISFPPRAEGLEAITNILVRRFANDFENVYTFCLTSPPSACAQFTCDWLVGITSKNNGPVRVGCGRYDWFFQREGLVERLKITIEHMWVLPAEVTTPIMEWLASLPYPWCPVPLAIHRMPRFEGAGKIADYMLRPQDRTLVAERSV